MGISKYKIGPHSELKLSKIKTDDTGHYGERDDAEKRLADNILRMAELLDKTLKATTSRWSFRPIIKPATFRFILILEKPYLY